MSVQTIPYFNEEVCRFRKLMGEKSFWEQPPEKRNLAIQGLGYVFLTTSKEDGTALDPKEVETITQTFMSTMDEYHMRETMILFGQLRA